MSLQNSLWDYLNRVKEDLNTALTLKKMERAYDHREENGKLYFKLARHQAALGATYTPGTGMSAYSTRVETYEYDPKSERIEIVECSEPVIDWDSVDCWGLAERATDYFSYDFKYDETKQSYLFSEDCCNLQKHVSGLDEALEVVKTEAESMCFDADCYPEIADLSKEQQKKFEQESIEAFKEIMTTKVREAWEDREEEEDW
mgnify:CR=1 FL=1